MLSHTTGGLTGSGAPHGQQQQQQQYQQQMQQQQQMQMQQQMLLQQQQRQQQQQQMMSGGGGGGEEGARFTSQQGQGQGQQNMHGTQAGAQSCLTSPSLTTIFLRGHLSGCFLLRVMDFFSPIDMTTI